MGVMFRSGRKKKPFSSGLFVSLVVLYECSFFTGFLELEKGNRLFFRDSSRLDLLIGIFLIRSEYSSYKTANDSDSGFKISGIKKKKRGRERKWIEVKSHTFILFKLWFLALRFSYVACTFAIFWWKDNRSIRNTVLVKANVQEKREKNLLKVKSFLQLKVLCIFKVQENLQNIPQEH